MTVSVQENDELNIRIVDEKYKVTYSIDNTRPSFTINIRTTGQLMQNEPDLDLEDPKIYGMVKEKLEKEIKSQILTILDRTKAEGVDSFGFGWQIFRTNKKLWQSKLENNWRETIKDLPVSVEIDADVQRLTNTGIRAKD